MYAVCKVSVNVCSVCERLVNVCSVCERLNAGFSVWSVSCCVSCVKCQLTCAARGASTSAFRMWVARWAAILWLRLFLLEKCSHGRKKKKKTNLNPDLVETYQVSPVRRMIPSGFRQRLTLMKRLQESVSRRQAHQDNTTPAPSILTHLAPGFKKKCNSAYFLISHRIVRSDSANAHTWNIQTKQRRTAHRPWQLFQRADHK